MKKKKLKALRLNKNTISNLQMQQTNGGCYKDSDACWTKIACPSVHICPEYEVPVPPISE